MLSWIALKETKEKDLAKQATELDSVGIICVYVNRVRGKKQRKSTKEGKSTEVTTRNADDVVHEKLLVKDSKSHSVAYEFSSPYNKHIMDGDTDFHIVWDRKLMSIWERLGRRNMWMGRNILWRYLFSSIDHTVSSTPIHLYSSPPEFVMLITYI